MSSFRKSLPTTRQGLRKQLAQRMDLSAASELEAWITPSIMFRDGRLGAEPRALGTTRFGGRPDLPDEVPWPNGPDGPLACLGQINLQEVAPFDVDRVLPASGWLLFFYNIVDHAWGRHERDRNKFAVLFIPTGAKLRRRDFPKSMHPENRLRRCRRVTPSLCWLLPTADRLALDTLAIGQTPTLGEPASDPATERYWSLDAELSRLQAPYATHRLLGWANRIYQEGEDCRLMCEVATRGFPRQHTAQFQAAHANRRRWRCLLEIGDDSDLYNGNTWADGGSIAFMIRDEDLRQRDFSRCWSVLSSS